MVGLGCDTSTFLIFKAASFNITTLSRYTKSLYNTSQGITSSFLVPLSDIHKENIPGLLDQLHLKYTKAILYKTVSSDLSDIKNLKEYDILAFYTPSGIKSLFQNFPGFVLK